MRLRTPTAVLLLALALALGGCGGGDEDPATDNPASDNVDTTAPTSESPAAEASVEAVPDAVSEILGERSDFAAGAGGAAPLETDIEGRECLLREALNGSCRGAGGTGGDFVVTAEGSIDAPGEWNVVVRCGLEPAVPAASAQGAFTPVIADLGLAPYGDVIGITLLGASTAEAALIYQPDGAECPVVWGVGGVDSTSLFTGGTDALNGSESPLAFRNAQGSDACAVADGQGGITVGTPQGGKCS